MSGLSVPACFTWDAASRKELFYVKKWLSLLAAAALLAALCVPALAAQTVSIRQPEAFPFTDVAEERWSYGAILYCWQEGLIEGKSAETFAPADTLTVEQAIVLTARMYAKNRWNGTVPALPDLTLPYARFYDENGTLFAALTFAEGPYSVSIRDSYVALSEVLNDTTLPETCTMVLGMEGYGTTQTVRGTRRTNELLMLYPNMPERDGLRGTGYEFPGDQQAIESFYNNWYLLQDNADAYVDEWWYPAAFYLNTQAGITLSDMVFKVQELSREEIPITEYVFQFNHDGVVDLLRGSANRAFLAWLTDLVLEEEPEILNQIDSIPDLDLVSAEEEGSFAGRVLRLYRAGIFTGMDEAGTFSGSSTLTREQAATILARVLDPARRVRQDTGAEARLPVEKLAEQAHKKTLWGKAPY